jgi:probable HAF family extracellular repeat protein
MFYSAFGLPQPTGSEDSSPRRLNEYDVSAGRLQVIGFNQCSGPHSPHCAYLWERISGTSPTQLNTVDLAQLSGRPESQAFGLNNVFPSLVAGWARGADGVSHQPLIWARSGNTTLALLGGRQGEAWDVDDLGNAVGWSESANGRRRACLWAPGRPPQDLGTLGGAQSQAVAVNAAGQIVGWAEDTTGSQHAFVWTPGATDGVAANPQMRDIHLPFVGETQATIVSFQTSTAIDINDAGNVVGELSGVSTVQGFLWTPGGRTLALGDWTSAHGISNAGLIVGWSQMGAGGAKSGILWNQKLDGSDLSAAIDQNAGWHIESAESINVHGDIACSAYRSQSSSPLVRWGIILSPK